MNEWISPNGIWKIHRPEWNAGRWVIENTKTGFSDRPIVYRDVGRVAFDYPEIVPNYVKGVFRAMAGAHGDRDQSRNIGRLWRR